MRKLKRINRNTYNLEHCCRWCRHYKEGKCWNKNIFFINGVVTNVYSIFENGYLAEVLEEVLNNERIVKSFLSKFDIILDNWKLSKKKKEEFKNFFIKQWSCFIDDCLINELCVNIDSCYQNHLISSEAEYELEGVEINYPREFGCQYWE